MSTRCHIEIFDSNDRVNPGCLLYHHSDGYPTFMKPKLDLFLKASFKYLKQAGYPYWWDSERVGACLIALSIEDYNKPLKPFSTKRESILDISKGKAHKPYRPNGGVPVFQPCLERHGDIEYIWKVFLLEKDGRFAIECYKESGERVDLGEL
jgi:hypothetical protein